MRHRTCIRCRIRYEPTISYVMYIRHRRSVSDIRHCIRCGDDNIRCRMCDIRCLMLTYDIVRHVRCRTYDVVRLYPVYRTYELHVRCTTRCRMLHVRHRTSCTYDIEYTYDIVGGKNPEVFPIGPGGVTVGGVRLSFTSGIVTVTSGTKSEFLVHTCMYRSVPSTYWYVLMLKMVHTSMP
jgi:hypothetical protein